MSDDWTTTEFLLRGRFCPLSLVADRLQALRAEMDADAALVLVADRRAVFRTLCMFVDRTRDPGLTAGLQKAIGTSAGLQDLVRGPSRPNHRSSYRFPRSTARIMEHLEKSFQDIGDPAASWFEPAPGWLPLLPSERLSQARIATAVLIYRPDPRWVERLEDGLSVVVEDRASIELAEMVNCTVQADVRRDALTATLVDQAVRWDGIAVDASGFSPAAQQLVQLAVEVADCQVGALYLGGIERITLAAMVHLGHDFPTTVPQQIIDPSTTALMCMDRNRAVQLSTWYPSRSMTGTFSSDTGDDGWSELATPVLGPSANMSLPPVGVLVVARAASKHAVANAFSSYDYSILRNVAIRLALLRATSEFEDVASEFGDVSLEFPEEDTGTTHPDVGPLLPEDIRVALPQIRGALARIVFLTGSHSGTFRAALPEAEDDEVGVALERVVAFPAAVLSDAQPRQPRDAGGMIWEAALGGHVASAPRTTEAKNFVPLRPGTQSALTLPVLVEGRLIGVINLESPKEDAYHRYRQAIALFATHVAHAISDARLMLSRALQALAIEVVTKRHDFAGDAKELKNLAGGLNEPVKWEIGSISERIDERARTLRVISDRGSAARGTLPDLLTSVLEDGPKMDVCIDSAVATWPSYEGNRATAIVECLRHVMTNVKEHASTKAGPGPSARVTEIMWGGRPHEMLHIVHRVDKQISPERAIDVYRVPLSTSERTADGTARPRPRFGAYLAGMQARRLDGDVWLTVLSQHMVRISIAIPRT
jgi:GAF domain-containing protein